MGERAFVNRQPSFDEARNGMTTTTNEFRTARLIEPYGGSLVDLLEPPASAMELKALATRLPSIQLSERSVCDLELLTVGAFSPLDRFMSRADHERVVGQMRLSGGHLFPIPVPLPVDDETPVVEGGEIALRNSKNELLAVLTVEEIYEWDRKTVAGEVFGTQDPRHPLVAEMERWGRRFVSGPMRVLQLPSRHDFRDLRLSPAETRTRL